MTEHGVRHCFGQLDWVKPHHRPGQGEDLFDESSADDDDDDDEHEPLPSCRFRVDKKPGSLLAGNTAE